MNCASSSVAEEKQPDEVKIQSPLPPLKSTLQVAANRIVATACGCEVPQPVEALQGTPPPFLCKTYDMVDDPLTDFIVSWSSTRNSFIVWNLPEFIKQLLPKYFRHNNFASFVRQLNTYGFRKVDPDRWEFAAEGFLRGQKHLLRAIHRRKPVSQSNSQHSGPNSCKGLCVEVGRFGGLEGEIEQLKRDKNVLMQELTRIRQQQQTTEQNLKVIGHRLLKTEQRQQQILSFLAKAMQNPAFFAHFVKKKEGKRHIEDGRKKRRLPKEPLQTQKFDLDCSSSQGQIIKYQPTSTDPLLIESLSSADSYSGSQSNVLREIMQSMEWDVNEQEDETSTSNSELHNSLDMFKSLDVIPKSDESTLTNLSNSLSTDSAITPLARESDPDVGNSEFLEMKFPTGDGDFSPEQPNTILHNDLRQTVMSDSVWQQFLDGFLAFEKVGLGKEGGNSFNHIISDLTTEDSDMGSPMSKKPILDQLTEQLVQLTPGATEL